jgi:hypothetical protein
MDGYQQDPHALDMVAKLAIDTNVVPHFSLSGGLLKYKNRIWIGDNPSLQTNCYLHATPVLWVGIPEFQ